MVMPAWARTSFSPSRRSLISSSTLSGALPVFGSSPMRPARYNVSPASTASLNGACTLFPGKSMYLREACGVGCERRPATVRIPATRRPARTIPTRRFMNAPSWSAPGAARNLRCGKCSLIPGKRQGGIGAPSQRLESDPAGSDEVERSDPDQYPQENALRQGSPADLLERAARNSGTDQKQRHGKTQTAQAEKHLGKTGLLRPVGIDHRRQTKQENKPRYLNFGAPALDGRRGQGQGNDPQRAGKLHGGRDEQGFVSIARGRSHNGTSVMNGQG